MKDILIPRVVAEIPVTPTNSSLLVQLITNIPHHTRHASTPPVASFFPHYTLLSSGHYFDNDSTFVFYPDDGGNTFLLNIDNTESHSRKQ
jgi:hypothetical protein